ncbi:MAG: hypothetical protein Q9220_002794 [cf. Caloplaca sp. 1 TL-2023]
MTKLIHVLGLSSTLAFHDVYSLDDPSLLAFIPRPVYALLLVFPVTPTYEAMRKEEDGPLPTYSGSGSGEEVIWFKQTIRNACGMMGLLHSLSTQKSGKADEEGYKIAPSTALAKLIERALPMDPASRAQLIETSPEISRAHAVAANEGNTAAPALGEEVDLHFVAFIKSAENNVWELDGRRKGPLNRGKVEAEEDVLAEKALDLGVRNFLKREADGQGGDLRFSLLALAPSMD